MALTLLESLAERIESSDRDLPGGGGYLVPDSFRVELTVSVLKGRVIDRYMRFWRHRVFGRLGGLIGSWWVRRYQTQVRESVFDRLTERTLCR